MTPMSLCIVSVSYLVTDAEIRCHKFRKEMMNPTCDCDYDRRQENIVESCTLACVDQVTMNLDRDTVIMMLTSDVLCWMPSV